MAAEIVAFRIVGKTFGTALRETTAVIAVFLAAMSIGYWAGGRIGDRRPRLSTIVAVLMGAAVTLIVVPWADALISPQIAISSLNLSIHALVASTILFSIPTALFAMVSPIAIRLFATSASESGSTAGGISAISTAGSIAGSLATAYFLLDWLASISRTVMAISLGATATALMILLSSAVHATGSRLRRYALGAAVMGLMIIPTAAFVRSTSLERTLVTTSREWKVLYAGDSAYHHIVIRDRIGKYREMLIGLAIQSRMPVNDPYGPGGPYTDAFHIARLMRPDTRRILLIGLGGGTAPKQMTRYYDDATIDVVEIDPLIVDLSKRYFDVRESDRLRIHVGDGRTFLSRSNEKWDLILVDAYTTNRYGVTIPPNLVTREFFTEAQRHLNEGGILHFHCAFGRSALLASLQKTMASVFSFSLTTSGEILASDVSLMTSPQVLAERARQSQAGRLPHLQDYIAQLRPSAFPSDTLLLTDDYAPVDTLLQQR